MLGHLPLSGWLMFVKLAHHLTRRCYCCSCRERAQCSAVCRLSYLLGGRGKRVLVRVLPLADNSWRECNERPCIEHGRCMINAAASFYFFFTLDECDPFFYYQAYCLLLSSPAGQQKLVGENHQCHHTNGHAIRALRASKPSGSYATSSAAITCRLFCLHRYGRTARAMDVHADADAILQLAPTVSA